MGDILTSTDTETPRIYVACLASYNAGYLHGAWIDATEEPWVIWESVRAMLAASPVADAEEWAIHDYEGFGDVRIAEYDGFERVSALASFIGEHGALGAALLAHFNGDLAEAQTALDDAILARMPALRTTCTT